MQSAVRLSTPPPPPPPDTVVPRKRSLSRSPSPPRRVRKFPLQDVHPNRAEDRRWHVADRSIPNGRPPTPPKPKTEEEKQAIAKAEYEKLLNMRSGGTYIPPAKLQALQAQITDKTSKEYQRMAWEALKVCDSSERRMHDRADCSLRNLSTVLLTKSTSRTLSTLFLSYSGRI